MPADSSAPPALPGRSSPAAFFPGGGRSLRRVTGAWRAHGTLEAGCRFMAMRADEGAVTAGRWGEVAHARLLGNRLLELDRFLSLLIDEIPGVDGQSAALPALRNTARKLDRFAIMARPDDARLRAIGRIAASFRHCDGLIHNVAIHDDMRLAGGMPGAVAGMGERGTRLCLTPPTIVAICDFYREIGRRLLALAGQPDPAT